MYDDHFHPTDSNDYDNPDLHKLAVKQIKSMDRGCAHLTRFVKKSDGSKRGKEITVYTSGSVGSNIRDAETGEYYKYFVGSADEDLFFKINISSGHCHSSNGSNTLFYVSPQQYMNHLHAFIDPKLVSSWETKRANRMKLSKDEKNSKN
jgi:hypothetical protein